MTNAEKFEEVFGKKPIMGNEPYLCSGCLGSNSCYSCKYSEQTRTPYQKEIEYNKRDPKDVQMELGLYHVEPDFKPSFMMYVVAKIIQDNRH